jgi:hypothetical protein
VKQTYIQTLRTGSRSINFSLAKRDYREAYESGDTDRIVDAQAKDE